MLRKKNVILALCFGLAVCICLVVFITSFKLNSFGEEFYKVEFEKYDVYGNFYGQDVDEINQEVLDYIKGKGDSLDTEVFEKNEIEHLVDVRGVIAKINSFYYWSWLISVVLMVVLFSVNRKGFVKNIIKVLVYSGLSTIILTLVILALVILKFDSVFTSFHHIFFPQGGWLFNTSDKIVNLYPSGLFYDIAKRIFFSVMVYGCVLILLGALGHKILVKYLNKGKNK
ncbi:MAG: DUF1461 domain-containing protein [Nanoarchaeota archaeon]|nr:DUF1461 domain-containing protein [Nanoarchaeota archaeon]MBU1004917.1 DUF1461 domain-containing protein [Nanoarchaeota archaeon]MBU1945637.1 DUF1461 domain-containing protein [Nanoarchaeota archaeon]